MTERAWAEKDTTRREITIDGRESWDEAAVTLDKVPEGETVFLTIHVRTAYDLMRMRATGLVCPKGVTLELRVTNHTAEDLNLRPRVVPLS